MVKSAYQFVEDLTNTVMNYGARLENFEGVWMTNSQPRQPGQELGSSAVPGHYS